MTDPAQPGFSEHGEPPGRDEADGGAVVLPDHLSFLRELDCTLGRANSGSLVGVALVSLECVNHIDGMLGYRAGDHLAAQVLRLLGDALKAEDEVFRVGRNELACLLRAVPSEGTAILAAYKILRTLDTRLRVEDQEVYVRPYIGVALFPLDGSSAEVLLRQANVAAHEARSRGDRFARYTADMDTPRRLQLQLQTALKSAIAENGLTLRFQPKIELRSGRVSGVETLVRWDAPHRGPIPPSQFIPVAEASGFISDLTIRVLNGALYHYDALRLADEHITLAVNLSPKDLLETELPDVIRHALKTWNVNPDRLVLELTETAVMDDPAIYDAPLLQLKEMGVRLSIDDFGTGYSSMMRLRNLPVDELKLDQCFVQRMLTSLADERIVRSVIDLAHNLGKIVVAEGVEDEATLLRLTEFGCDQAQGYHLSHPLSAEQLGAFLIARKT